MTSHTGYAIRQPNNVDYLSLVRDTPQSASIKIHPEWIKGHQNTSKFPVGSNRLNVERNNKVDELATWYREQTSRPQSSEQTDHEHGSKVTISINNRRLVSQIELSIRYHIDNYHLRQYIQHQRKWDDKTWTQLICTPLVVFIGDFHHPSKFTSRKWCSTSGMSAQIGTNKQKLRILTFFCAHAVKRTPRIPLTYFAVTTIRPVKEVSKHYVNSSRRIHIQF
jgi:hypothetical protein